jgi:hypothetical protein
MLLDKSEAPLRCVKSFSPETVWKNILKVLFQWLPNVKWKENVSEHSDVDSKVL